MTPRPIHRLKTFWFGLFILTALAWAWTLSISHSHFASLRTGPITWRGFSSTRGQITYSSATYKNTTYFDPSRTSTGSFRFGPTYPRIWFPPALKLGPTSDPTSDGYKCAIAYWLITLLFLISWSSLLLWRRRKPKHLTPPQAPHHHGPTPHP